MKIIVVGSSGRVGSAVCKILKEKNIEVAPIEKNITQENVTGEAVIDFSSPDATEMVCALCERLNAPLIMGTTGQNQNQLELINKLSSKVEVVQSGNFSNGLGAMKKLVEMLCYLCPKWEREIIEIHHSAKKDSPSKTALELAKIVENITGDIILSGRYGKSNSDECAIHSVRCGSIFGEH
ncbi:MAG: dihydrodipicolinate reductase C-terminal domain-containing protein, partial [Clostridia bacterium]